LKDSILYVDDRINNLQSFKATFRREYEVFIAESPREALILLSKHPIKVAIADYKMPEISGVTFLEIVKKQYPSVVRIMLTGHADLPAVAEAINRSEIFRFLAKPWDEGDLRKGVQNAIELFNTRSLLIERNEELKKAYNELDRLVFSTAHDITGPLANVLGLVNIIRSEPENLDYYLKLVERTVNKLQLITRDVLTFHENKRSELLISEIDMKQMVANVIEDHRYLKDMASLNLDFDIDNSRPFHSDINRIRFILSNLVSNAIKYQDQTKTQSWVHIAFKCSETESTLTFSDNGIGINKDVLPKVFNIFYRASNKSTGAGIGLYLVSEAVQLLNGKISVDSVEGEGTTFTLQLPNAENPSAS
jgi:signal transduction histidine kinase